MRRLIGESSLFTDPKIEILIAPISWLLKMNGSMCWKKKATISTARSGVSSARIMKIITGRPLWIPVHLKGSILHQSTIVSVPSFGSGSAPEITDPQPPPAANGKSMRIESESDPFFRHFSFFFISAPTASDISLLRVEINTFYHFN